MILTINGVDITPFIASGGIKWSRNDIEAPNTGRTMDGTMMRGRVTTKIRLDITCIPLIASDLAIVLNAIYPEFVTVRYTDPMYGTRIVTMYSNNNPASFLVKKPNGDEYWTGITFPLIER
jgi:hypothetical protein